MKSTKPKLIKKRNKVITPSKVWTKEAFESYREYQTRYTKENYRTFAFRLKRDGDGDLIEWFESQENLADYIRELGRKDMEEKKSHK